MSCLLIADLAFRRKLSTIESPAVRMARALFAGALPQVLLAPWMEARLIVWVWLIAAAYYGLSSTRASFTAHHHAGRARALEAWAVQWAALLLPLSYLVWLLGTNFVLSVKHFPITGVPTGTWRFAVPGFAAFLLATSGARLLSQAVTAAQRPEPLRDRLNGGAENHAANHAAEETTSAAEDLDSDEEAVAAPATRAAPAEAMRHAVRPDRAFREARRAREASLMGICTLLAGLAAGGQGAVMLGAALILAAAWRMEPMHPAGRPSHTRPRHGGSHRPERPLTPNDRKSDRPSDRAADFDGMNGPMGAAMMRSGRNVGPTLAAVAAGIAAAGWLRWVMTLSPPM